MERLLSYPLALAVVSASIKIAFELQVRSVSFSHSAVTLLWVCGVNSPAGKTEKILSIIIKEKLNN